MSSTCCAPPTHFGAQGYFALVQDTRQTIPALAGRPQQRISADVHILQCHLTQLPRLIHAFEQTGSKAGLLTVEQKQGHPFSRSRGTDDVIDNMGVRHK